MTDTTASILAASIFLKHTPLLTTLWLSFLDRDWKDTERIFIEIADTVILSNLKNLTINGLRCIGQDMELFLQNHNSLEHLVFNNMDIEPPGTLADVLDKASCLKYLTKFRCSQIAQDGFRVKFKTLCHVEVSDEGWSSDRHGNDEHPVWVNQFKYIGVAEEWENVSSKLHDLSRDVVVTTREIHTDWEEGYQWRD
jgi:hypothetical protein